MFRFPSLLLFLPVLLSAGCGEFEITLTGADLMARLAKRFPVTREYPPAVAVTLRNTEVILEEGAERMRVGFEAEVSRGAGPAARPSLKVGLEVAAGVEYAAETGEFFLTGCRVVGSRIGGLSSADDPWLKAANMAASYFLEKRLDGLPVYNLDRAGLRGAVARLLLKKVRIADGRVIITMGF